MSRELEKYGIQMPAFGKIGGILANEVIMIIISYLVVVRTYLNNIIKDRKVKYLKAFRKSKKHQ